jgi:hypothetical protein
MWGIIAGIVEGKANKLFKKCVKKHMEEWEKRDDIDANAVRNLRIG